MILGYYHIFTFFSFIIDLAFLLTDASDTTTFKEEATKSKAGTRSEKIQKQSKKETSEKKQTRNKKPALVTDDLVGDDSGERILGSELTQSTQLRKG